MAELDQDSGTPTRASREAASSTESIMIGSELAAFHTTVLVTALALVAHRSGDLGAALGGAGTLTGTLAFLFLWATTTWATRRAIGPGLGLKGARQALRMLGRATVWGGLNGTVFFLGLLATVLARTAVEGLSAGAGEGGGLELALAPWLWFYGLIGSAVAFLAGSVIGALLGSFDLVAGRAAAILAARCRAQ